MLFASNSDRIRADRGRNKDRCRAGGGGDEEVMLLNEPGQYVYANLKFKF